MNIQQQPKIHSIQALRAIAALMVLVYHIFAQQIHYASLKAADTNILTDQWLSLGPWQQGYAGIDLFFVISGFVMVYVSFDRGRSLKDIRTFLYRRLIRIYPIWWVFASLYAAYFFVIYGLWGSPDLRGGAIPDFSYFIRSLLLIPQESKPVLLIGWTLIHEMQFYLIFAVILFFPRKFMLPALGLWGGLNVMGYLGGWQSFNTGFSILFSVLTLEFIAGAFVGWCVLKQKNVHPKWFFIAGCFAALLAVIFYTDKSRSMVAWGRVAVYTLPFAALLYGAATLERQGRLSCPRWLVAVGDWSYSLYLSHYLVLIVIIRFCREAQPYLPETLVNTFKLGAPGIWDNLAFTIIAIIASLITAAISYHLIERPVLAFARRRK